MSRTEAFASGAGEEHLNHPGVRIQVEAARRKAASDYKVPVEEIHLHSLKVNPSYDPQHRSLAPGEFQANGYRYPPHTEPEGNATHTVEFTYPYKGRSGLTTRAHSLWGFHQDAERPPEIWMD